MKKYGMLSLAMLVGAAPAALAEAAEKSVFAVGGGALLIVAVIALAAALIAVSIMKGALRTAHHQDNAGRYVREGSFDLRVRQEHFLYQSVERRKIEQEKKD